MAVIDIAGILQQIPDLQDKAALSRIVKKYEIVRVRLLSVSKFEHHEAFETQKAEWVEWYAGARRQFDDAQQQINILRERCEALQREKADLEHQVAALLERCRPANNVLYQSG